MKKNKLITEDQRNKTMELIEKNKDVTDALSNDDVKIDKLYNAVNSIIYSVIQGLI